MRCAVAGLCIAGAILAASSVAFADPMTCDLGAYQAKSGLTAVSGTDDLTLSWSGEGDQQLRLTFGLHGGRPVIRALALRRAGKDWVTLARDVTPDYAVMTGLRRISAQQLEPLYGLGIKITQDVLNQYRWDPFWDAPFDLSVPKPGGRFSSSGPPPAGLPGTDQPGLPRKAEEIQRAEASYHVDSCRVKSDGARIDVEFPGVHLGLFDGTLQYTIFRGTNLIRQQVMASTAAPWVAYKYDAGLKGLAIGRASHMRWRDIANVWQDYAFGGQVNDGKVPLAAANRVAIAEQADGSIAAFPPPHKFFWAREVATNMGYNWYRKDSDDFFSFGIRQNEHEDPNEGQGNWALYSARPGTQQLMPVFFYPSLTQGKQTAEQVLAFTHDDHYKPLPGYQVMQHHYHMYLGQRLLEEHNLNAKLPDLQAIKALGINIVSQIDSVILTGFSVTGAAISQAQRDAGALPPQPDDRPPPMMAMAASVEGARRSSDTGFLVMADQEVFGGPLGGHTDLLFRHPVYWDQRKPGQPFAEQIAPYGQAYHIGSAEDFMKMVDAENVMVSMPHPRTKGSAGFPDAIKDRDYFNDPHFHGFGLRWGMGLDGSERKTCEYRCLPMLDDLSNWVVDRPEPLKFAISISEVMHQQPGDDIYASAPVTYVHLDKLPPASAPAPVIDALTRGDMFITTGEVLVPHFEIRGRGERRVAVADVEWTFPLDQVELVWGDGKTTGHQTVSATGLAPFGRHHFEIPFDARGKKWIRFAAWDSAYEGAILEPQRIAPSKE